MTAYTAARALDILPSGGTRLHRAILKSDTEAMLGWVQAGADPWAMSGPLPDNLRLRIWGHNTGSRGVKRPKGPHELSAVALAVLLVTEATWPAVQALLARTDLTLDTPGWVFEAATLTKRPPTPEQVEEARWRNIPLSPHRPDDLWATLLAHGLLPPAQDRLPSEEHGPGRRSSALANLPAAWRVAMEDHWSLARLARVFQPGHSPLDQRPPARDAAGVWTSWIEGGLPIVDLQHTLLNWVEHAPRSTSEEGFIRVIQALQARGARLDQPAERMGIYPAYWPTPAGWAVETGHLDRATVIQRLQGRTLADEAGAPGTWSPAVEVVGRNAFTHPQTFRFSGLFQCVKAGLNPLALGSTAKGWHELLQHLEVTEFRDNQELVHPFRSWLNVACALQVPAVGEESGTSYDAVETYVDRVTEVLTQHGERAQWAIDLTSDVGALAQLVGVVPTELAQAQLHRLTAQGHLLACAWWGPALVQQGAQWDMPGPDGQTPRAHLLRDLSSLARLDLEHTRPVLNRLAKIGVDPWTVDEQGATIWDHWPRTHRLDLLAQHERIRLDWKTELDYVRYNELDRRLKEGLTQAEIADWFVAPVDAYVNKGPLTRLERFAQTDGALMSLLPTAAALSGLSARERAIALLPFTQNVRAQQLSSKTLDWEGALAFLTSQVRQAGLDHRTPTPAPGAPSRPRRRT